MSLTKSYKAPEFHAYEGLIRLIAAFQKTLDEPPDLLAIRAEALKAVDEARMATEVLDAERVKLAENHNDVLSHIDAKAKANEAKAIELKNAQKTLDNQASGLTALSAQLETKKSDLETLHTKLSSKQQELNTLSTEFAKKHVSLLERETTISNKEKELLSRHEALTTKEKALRQFLG